MSIGNIDPQVPAVGRWTHEIKVTSEGNAVFWVFVVVVVVVKVL